MAAVFKFGGYAGQLLRVNLTTKVVSKEPLREDWARDFVGGVGYAARLLYDELASKIDPLGPENKLVFMTGPTCGTLIPSGSRGCVCGKSPATGSFFHSIYGGYWAAELKFAGYDGVILEGKSDKPVYLWIDDDKIELRSAEGIWGKSTVDAEMAIRHELGDDEIQIATIGKAGELGTPYAMILVGIRAAGRGGLGAVMGSKMLKAVAVRGSGNLHVPNMLNMYNTSMKLCEALEAPTKGLLEYGTARNSGPLNAAGILPTHNWQTEVFSGIDGITGETMKKEVVKANRSCFACSVNCTKYSVVPSGPYKSVVEGPDYETLFGYGSMCEVGDIRASCKADELCDEYGLDLMSASCTIAWAMECYEKGIFTKEDTGGIDLRFGNAEAMIKMTEMIGKREGLGALLAEGVREASKIVGKGSERFAVHVKGLELAGHTPRPFPATAVGYATGPRGGSHHDSRTTMEKFGMVERKTLEGKGALAAEVNHFLIFTDSVILCHLPETFWGPSGIKETVVEALNAVTGWKLDVEQAHKIAERQWNMIRCFCAREGFTRKDDQLPVRMMEEPIPEGPMKGEVMPLETLERLKNDYYSYRGWDLESGNPTREKLTELGLEFAIKDVCP
ncbi:MAG TPA: aldehyde ferredoxin oxidoreductase family protein [Chloroflexota bacterium]|nr:aldehyde ferredoxin oxidoreductase family protein [Chloroflexota bacterium]